VRIALFGGTFDPIHSGHLRAARAAARRYRLDRVLFVPSGNPPHKLQDRLSPFAHRYAMVALAASRDPRFVPSLLESPTPDGRRRYSIDTVRAAKRQLKKSDELFFLIGADAFLDLPHWKSFHRLLRSTQFIVVLRPGISPAEIAGIIPRPWARSTTIHVLAGLNVAISSREIRHAIRAGNRVTGLVPPLVEQYIEKEGLYRPAPQGQKK
jgi:nicotinate-nucleotide adenylyltransferase